VRIEPAPVILSNTACTVHGARRRRHRFLGWFQRSRFFYRAYEPRDNDCDQSYAEA